MKKYILLGFLTVFSVAMKGQADTAFISLKPAEFRDEMKKTGHVLIDVREPFEYNKSRIRGAINISSHDDLSSLCDTINSSSPIFVYCTSGFRSSRAAKTLIEEGCLYVYNLDGGITGWKKAGLPVERRRKRK